MTRITSLLASAALLCGAAFGGSRSESTTYVDGNITGVSPNTGGTLLFSDDKAVYFRTGLTTVPVPYAGISKAELGATKVHSEHAPLYKVWSLHKRFAGKKSESQFLTIEFKNDEGEDKTMTLEMEQGAASTTLSAIQGRITPEQKTEVASAEPAKSKAAPQAAPQSE